MNMNKALQNLYHAVSGETTTKVNISKLLVDIHYAITGKESENKNNWSKIVNSMADNWPEGGGGSWTVLTEESVTTADQGGFYAGSFAYVFTEESPSKMKITFNGTAYECDVIAMGGNYAYGGVGEQGPDFSVYPFAVTVSPSRTALFTETAGTYTVKLEAPA